MLAVTFGDGAGMDALTEILLPALGTYDGRVVVVTVPAISYTASMYTVISSTDFHTIASNISNSQVWYGTV